MTYLKNVFSSITALALVFSAFVPLVAIPSVAHAASSIEFASTPPEGCVFAGGEIEVTGLATADAPPGQLEQYKVDVNWGDGSNTLATIDGGTFGSGQGISSKAFSASHVYTSAGAYSVVATVFHKSINGKDNVDTKAQEYEICVIPDPETFTLTYEAGAGGTISGTSPQEVEEGADGAEVTAVPDEGYSFVDWSDGILTASRTETDVTEDVSVTANFAADPVETYTITVNQSANGSITPGTQNDVAEGSDVLFTITPDTGFHILDVLIDAVSQGAITTYEFLNVMADHVITATFEENAPNTFTLMYSATAGGTIAGDVSQVIADGTDGTEVEAIADSGFHFVSWSDGATTTTRTDVNVTADAAYTASFEENAPACSDQSDNDDDGLTDSADPGCHTDGDAGNPESYDPEDNDETDPVVEAPACSDGIDNDEDGLTDSADPGCHTDGDANNESSYNPEDNDETDPTTPPTDVCSNIDGVQESVPEGMTELNGVCTEIPSDDEEDNGGGRSSSGGYRTPRGEVLGQVLGESCGLYMDQYLKRANPKNNPVQVTKLQEFLVKHGFGTFAPTGYFGPLTEASVKAFQAKYATEILAPWNIAAPTGLAYLTTIRQLNLIECPELVLPVPALIPWSNNPAVR